MDLVSTIRKSGSRGGVNFSWDEVANSAHRENYLGHSLKAPVGRWQAGRDLQWYAKADSDNLDPNETEEERKARLRREEIQKIKEAEEDAMAKALGLPPPAAFNPAQRRRISRKDDAGDDMKAKTRGGIEVTGSIVTGTGIAVIAAEKTVDEGEIGTTKARFPHVTTAEGTRTGVEVAIPNVTGDTDAKMIRAAKVAARTTDEGAGPETEMGTDTVADLRTAGGASARIADEVKNKRVMAEKLESERVSAPPTLTSFSNLPFELRREVWHHHFNSHRNIHVICSANNTYYPPADPPLYPLYLPLDAATNETLHPQDSARLALASQAHYEARAAFRETHVVADLTTCGPGLASYPRDRLETYARGKLSIAASRRLLSRVITSEQGKGECDVLLKRDAEAGAVRFPVNVNTDLVYFLDYQNGRMFSKLCGASWMSRVKQIALAVVDGRFGPGIVWNHENMGDEIRRHNEPEGGAGPASFMSGETGRFSTFSLVVIPATAQSETSLGALDIRRDEFGFAALEDCAKILSEWELSQAKEVIERVTTQIEEAFPPGNRPYEIRSVVDIDCKLPVGVVTYKRRLRAPKSA
ncbi:hypothetical protein VMCG_02962 [Cytospora schulzeri]|uniref:Uncharacterized protein n=1 Tax=Cytospora schulzeri TaxID=448051 RepID=A0A423WZK5_9PEZI|nr:hypothetical protein VMCG_02962 [Valsa malicola]